MARAVFRRLSTRSNAEPMADAAAVQLTQIRYSQFAHMMYTRNPLYKKVRKMAQQRGAALQDPFLNILRREKVPVSIFLVNGIKLQGQIESFDQFVVLLRNSVNQMIYKHAISTVVPARPIRIPHDGGDRRQQQQGDWGDHGNHGNIGNERQYGEEQPNY